MRSSEPMPQGMGGAGLRREGGNYVQALRFPSLDMLCHMLHMSHGGS